MDNQPNPRLVALQCELQRKNRAFDLILEVLKPWPENAGGRFGEIRTLAREGKT